MPHLIRAAARRMRAGEDGFTLLVVMLVLTVLVGLSVAALDSAGRDIGPSGYSRAQKKALAAAHAGIEWYQAEMAQDPSYWAKCTTGPVPSDMKAQGLTGPPVNDPGAASPRWRTLNTTQQYMIELLPANGAAACNTATPDTTMIDSSSRTFRIRAVGRAGAPAANCGTAGNPRCPATRSVVATFHRSSFLDYLYFTDFETYDPQLQMFAWRDPGLHGNPTAVTSPTDFKNTWAPSNCAKHWWEASPNGRGDQSLTGQSVSFTATGGSQNGQNFVYNNQTMTCNELSFANVDVISGPVHTNDSITVCGHPVFGRTPNDTIEIANQNPDLTADPVNGNNTTGKASWRKCASDPTSSPTFTGTPNLHAGTLGLPVSNSALSSSAMQFSGKTTITLSGTTVTVSSRAGYGTPSSYTGPFPASGVIYVNDGSDCASTYNPLDPRTTGGSVDKCANVLVSGTYDGSLTIASAQDIIVTGNLTKANTNSMLGLVANNWVRVNHAVSSPPADWDQWGQCTSSESSPLASVTIDAAIIALNHSFLVDNWMCGPAHTSGGGLNVNGAIAQKYRGPVAFRDATGNVLDGYAKTYTYDDRLRTRSPPQFLDPTSSAWVPGRIVEQVG